MVSFWDASAVVPLCVRERQTPLVEALSADDPDLVVWWATRTECVSALARQMREGRLNADRHSQARARLNAYAEGWTEIAPTEGVRLAAERLLLVHPLRAADAFQLAGALEWTDHRPAGAGFVSLDLRLRESAQREGFFVQPEQV